MLRLYAPQHCDVSHARVPLCSGQCVLKNAPARGQPIPRAPMGYRVSAYPGQKWGPRLMLFVVMR